MAPTPSGTRRRAPLTLIALGSLGALWVRQGAFSALPGISRKQKKAGIHQRSNFKETLEVEPPQEEEELEPREPLPERRVPYSFHVEANFAHHKHLKDESRTRKLIESKITHAFQNQEDIIQHVSVSLLVSETFHRHGRGADAEILAPYIFKCTVSLKNKKTVVLGSPEKHAQATLMEGLDHMVEVVKRQLSKEKDKFVEARRKMKNLELMEASTLEEDLEMMEAERLAEEAEALADEEAAKMYEMIEASVA